jgi:hypothetical protein
LPATLLTPGLDLRAGAAWAIPPTANAAYPALACHRRLLLGPFDHHGVSVRRDAEDVWQVEQPPPQALAESCSSRRGELQFIHERAAAKFTSSPVADEFERRFRADYIAACARSVTVLNLADFAESEADRRRFMTARWTAAVVAALGAVTGLTVAGWVLAAVMGAVGFVVGAYIGAAVGSVRRARYLTRVAEMADDRKAYAEWSAASTSQQLVCACSFRSRERLHSPPDFQVKSRRATG